MNNNQNDKESLARSHSAASNTKLTFLCIFTTICFTVFWIGLALIGKPDVVPVALSYVLAIAGGVLTVLGLIGFNLFKR